MNTNMKEDSKALVVYHKDDNDGVFSAAIVINYLIHELNVKQCNIDTIKADYTSFRTYTSEHIDKWVACYDNIIFTDISMNDTTLFKYLITTAGNKFTWVDHHRPIIEWSMRENLHVNGFLDISNSAIYNMYMHLYNPFNIEEGVPEIFKILSAWDSFNFKQYDKMYAYYVNIGVNFTYNILLDDVMSFVETILYGDFDKTVSDETIQKFYDDGMRLARYEKNKIDNIVMTCGDMEFTVGGRSACALFMQGASSSLMFDCVKDAVQNGIVFKRQKNNQWVVSLYNTNDGDDSFDCGQYCKQHYKGGGHKGAAGFTITDDGMKAIMIDKCI